MYDIRQLAEHHNNLITSFIEYSRMPGYENYLNDVSRDIEEIRKNLAQIADFRCDNAGYIVDVIPLNNTPQYNHNIPRTGYGQPNRGQSGYFNRDNSGYMTRNQGYNRPETRPNNNEDSRYGKISSKVDMTPRQQNYQPTTPEVKEEKETTTSKKTEKKTTTKRTKKVATTEEAVATNKEAPVAKKETTKKAKKEEAVEVKKEVKPTVTEAKASALTLKITPRKCRLSCDLVRGKNCDDALAILANTHHKSASLVAKVIKSAMANATNNFNMNEEKLYLPRAKGSASGLVKRYTNLYVVVKERM